MAAKRTFGSYNQLSFITACFHWLSVMHDIGLSYFRGRVKYTWFNVLAICIISVQFLFGSEYMFIFQMI